MSRQHRQGGAQRLDLGRHRPVERHQIADPQRQAVDENEAPGSAFAAQGGKEIERFLDRGPAPPPGRPMPRYPLRHFGIAGLAGRDIDQRAADGAAHRLGMTALAGPGPAENEGAAPLRQSSSIVPFSHCALPAVRASTTSCQLVNPPEHQMAGPRRIAFVASDSPEARVAESELIARYGYHALADALLPWWRWAAMA